MSVGRARRAEAGLYVEVFGVDFDDFVAASVRGVQSQDYAAVVAELVAVAVTCVEELVDILCAQRNETESVCEKLVGQDGGVDFDFYQVDGDRGDFGDACTPY